MAEISRAEYVASFGPSKGDRIRLADTDLVIEVERRNGGFRPGLAQRQTRRDGEEFIDLAFRYADEAFNQTYAAAGADRPVTLFINDYNTEQGGKQDRYVALVRPEAVGLGLTAYINVRLEKHTETHKRNPMDVFRASVQTWPEVVECYAMSGDMDYLLRVQVEDLTAFSRFAMDKLMQHPAVVDMRSSFTLQRIKETTQLQV